MRRSDRFHRSDPLFSWHLSLIANAMNASASIFEALSEVDSKYAKIADKEYDIVSIEVKKWFKKLAVSA